MQVLMTIDLSIAISKRNYKSTIHQIQKEMLYIYFKKTPKTDVLDAF